MKINMPVTNQEIFIKEGLLLATRTDLKGVITYANDEFVKASGFTREELIGSEHNIVRHPDMPQAVFEDLWLTLQELRPWQGLVKNRTKSGDYYWLEANAMPVFKNGQVHEYLSVRRVPSRKEIEKAEQFHKQLNANKATMRPSGLAAAAKSIKEMDVSKKITFASAMHLVPAFYLMYQLFLAQDYPLLAGVLASSIAASAIDFNVAKTFSRLLNKTIGTFYRLAEKKFGKAPDLSRNDLIGDFQRALYSMEMTLRYDLTQSREDASKAMRLTEALDHVHAGIMVADTNLEIIYANDSIREMFKKAENAIRKQLPNFNADKLLGSSIDLYHTDPAHQRRLLNNLTKPYNAQMVVADQHMHVIASPVINQEGENLGFIAEWQNRTADVLIEQEIEQLVQAIKVGDLSTRISMDNKEGIAKMLSAGINELSDVIESVFNDVNSVMERMAEGDLACAITHHYEGIYDECKDNINDTLAKLSDFIIQIKNAANFIESSSQEMAAGNNDLSSRAEQQAASLEETAASMEELSSTVKNNSQQTVQATEAIHSAIQVAQKGGEIVKSAIAAMQEINVSSNNIAEIIGVIDEIAFQTNLLALNAAVEAARAGDHGRGFAVVATEVRNLAQRSANAAKQSSDLIQNSVEKVRAGTAFVNETGTTLIEIVDNVEKVGDIISHIASASAEQSAGIGQVNQAISQMDDITQQNAALAEQAAAGGISMSEQSTNMAKLVSFFKVNSNETDDSIKTFKHGKTPAVPIKAAAKTATVSQALLSTKSAIDSNDDWEEF
ncbi:methyl-accepting chemotaxis protein [Candidatus Methylobacter oryzae]|uniref:PAS domain-containing protein n=1 Tax=Candidatus Methylobacter oryzae TaxID=2497749 RepID=A0ABY3C508_9GAMM|nr:methyl-accepting chemotaxis protein [Candidatus Methylobacter oryzae]TRW89572.1 PAS domain-containing protein [Candidatus Methylobacter oryzae]